MGARSARTGAPAAAPHTAFVTPVQRPLHASRDPARRPPDSGERAARKKLRSNQKQRAARPASRTGAGAKVVSDSTRLVQAVANLLDNAAKYTDYGGVISLSAEQDKSDVVIGIRDNGHGMSAELLACIFDLYAQLNCPAHRPDLEGLGIGLALVRTIIQMHGGEIRVFSAGIDKGSEFALRLPILKQVGGSLSSA